MVDATAGDALAARGVSPREREVLEAVAERRSNAEIAAALGVSERTVESHVSSLLRKLGVATRRQLEPFARAETPARRAGPPDLPLALQRLCDDGPWFGRDTQLAGLLKVWTTTSETRVAVVRGEPGIGKSRLVAELAAEVRRRGGAVALGACSDRAQSPFAPFVTGLRSVGATLDQDPRLARLETENDGDGGEVVDPERERYRVQGALIDAIVAASGPDGLLFIVEDLHWASDATREVFEVIARSPRPSRVLVVATTRDGTGDRYAAFLGRLDRFAGVTTMSLGGLNLDAATQLIEAEGSRLDPADGVSQSGGNPLFLRQLARHGPASRSMGEAVADLFVRLDDAELDILDFAVVSGDPIDPALVATSSGHSLDEVFAALDRAEAVGIVGAGERPGTFVFSHDVFRSGREAMLSSGRRMQLHAAIAAGLDRADLDPRLVATVALHASLAGRRFDVTRAAELARRAGDIAMRAADHGAAAESYRRALESMTLDPAADDGARLAVKIDLGQAMMLSGQRDGELIVRDALHDARRRGDARAAAAALTAVTQVPGGHASAVFGDAFEAMAVDAIDALPPTEVVLRIRLMGSLGIHLYFGADVERGQALLDEAVELARSTGDPVTLGRALMAHRWSGGAFAMERRIACGHELLELGERTGEDVFSLVGCQQLAWCHSQLRGREELGRWIAAAARLVRGRDIEQLTIELSIALLDSELDIAERLAREIVDLEGPGRPYGEGAWFLVREIRGQLLGAEVLERAIAARPDRRWFLDGYLARALARTRRTASARRVLADIRARGYGPRGANEWTSTMTTVAETAALCGDLEVATDAAELLEPLAGRWGQTGIGVWDTVDRARALCLLTVGDAATSAALARGAAEASRRQATWILQARELVVAAAADVALGRGVDEALLREALAISHRTGARIIEQDARLLLGTAHVPDVAGLTPREREVLDHVALGETNRQIAHALRVSESTVRKHLEVAFKKLGASTRTAAVVRAAGSSTE
jgi:DNA-binding NarL/FixJ family response regulator